jgi:hypothetical protein
MVEMEYKYFVLLYMAIWGVWSMCVFYIGYLSGRLRAFEAKKQNTPE